MSNRERFLLVVAALFGNSAIAFVVATGFVAVRLLYWVAGASSITARVFWYLAIANACFFLLGGVLSTAATFTEVFFPKTGVGNPSLFPGFTSGRRIASRGVIGVLVLVGFGLIARYESSYAYMAVIVALMTVSSPVSTAFDEQKRAAISPPLLDALKMLLIASDYKIVDRVQTGSLALDRLISVFDLVAHKNGNALAIQLKTTASGSEPVTWTEASALPTAVRALYQNSDKRHSKIDRIWPVLVLFGRTAHSSLADFAKAESIRLIVVPSDAPLEAIVKGEFTTEKLRGLAKDYLPIEEASAFGETAQGLPAESTA